MIDRRRFSFAALLAVGGASSVARAEGIAKVVAVGAAFTATHRKGVLEVKATLTNQSSEPLEVQSLLGSRPGPRLEAHRVGAPADEYLAEIVRFDKREMISRMGPPPTFVALAPGKSIEVGPYKFETPEGHLDAVELRLIVYTMQEEIVLAPEVVTLGEARAAS